MSFETEPAEALDLAAIKARAEGATHGPWILAPVLCGPNGQGVYCPDLGKVAEVGDPYPRQCNNPQESMEFIAHARTDVPALVAEVERLRGQVEAARGHLVAMEPCIEGVAAALGDGTTAGMDLINIRGNRWAALRALEQQP